MTKTSHGRTNTPDYCNTLKEREQSTHRIDTKPKAHHASQSLRTPRSTFQNKYELAASVSFMGKPAPRSHGHGCQSQPGVKTFEIHDDNRSARIESKILFDIEEKSPTSMVAMDQRLSGAATVNTRRHQNQVQPPCLTSPPPYQRLSTASNHRLPIKMRASIPRRRSSLASRSSSSSTNIQRSGRPDPVHLHRQSVQLFSSLDGVMALSRDFTPLPSAASSPSGTRPVSVSSNHTYRRSRDSNSRDDCHMNPSVPAEYCFATRTIDTEKGRAVLVTTTEIPTSESSGSTTPEIEQESSISRHGPNPAYSNHNPQAQRQPRPPNRPPTSVSVISWLSNETRKNEYDQIDRNHNGVRGWMRKHLPTRMLPKSQQAWPRNFFDPNEEKHQTNQDQQYDSDEDIEEEDADSVRRYRMDVAVNEGYLSQVENGTTKGQEKEREKLTKELDNRMRKLKHRSRFSCF